MIHRELRWIGHVIGMPENLLPKRILYGELSESLRYDEGQKQRFKDHPKVSKTVRY